MTVSELIGELQKHDGKLEVMIEFLADDGSRQHQEAGIERIQEQLDPQTNQVNEISLMGRRWKTSP
jgi:hypothetical protein